MLSQIPSDATVGNVAEFYVSHGVCPAKSEQPASHVFLS